MEVVATQLEGRAAVRHRAEEPRAVAAAARALLRRAARAEVVEAGRGADDDLAQHRAVRKPDVLVPDQVLVAGDVEVRIPLGEDAAEVLEEVLARIAHHR